MALQVLADEIYVFLQLHPDSLPVVTWESELKERAVSYSGEEVYSAERLPLERLSEALPPAAACGAVEAADVCTGFVRD